MLLPFAISCFPTPGSFPLFFIALHIGDLSIGGKRETEEMQSPVFSTATILRLCSFYPIPPIASNARKSCFSNELHPPLLKSRSSVLHPLSDHSISGNSSRIPRKGSNDDGFYSKSFTVGDFMTKKEDVRVVQPTTNIVEAMEMLVEFRINGFPVVDEDWKLVGVVSDYDLLASGSASLGSWVSDKSMFPEVDSPWKKFNELRKLQSKSNCRVVGDLMTSSPLLVVQESTCLEDAASLLLRTKHRRLPVVDFNGKLVGIITRGNVVRAALALKRWNK